jgi:hypothetical protein
MTEYFELLAVVEAIAAGDMTRESMVDACKGVLVPVDDEDDDGAVYQCGNCGEFWKEAELVTPIQDIHERVAPGEPMPAGECPTCGACCHKNPVAAR